MPTISGTVYDDTGAVAPGRIVRAYRRDTGALLGATTSSDGTAAPGTGDPFFSNVTLLIPADVNKPNDVSPAQLLLTYSPPSNTASISTAQSHSGGASIYISTTGASVSVPAGSGIAAFGTADFTVEFWFRQVSSYDVQMLMDAGDWTISIYGAGIKFAVTNVSGGVYFYASGDFMSKWNHVVFMRKAGKGYGFVNGVLKGYTPTFTTTIFGPTSPAKLFIGKGSSYIPAVPAFYDDIRITKAARYTVSEAVPTEAYPTGLTDPLWSRVSVLLHFDGGVSDSSAAPNTWVVSTTGAIVETTKKKFGAGSLSLTGGYVKVQGGGWLTPSNPPTYAHDNILEFWVYMEEVTATVTLIDWQFYTGTVNENCHMKIQRIGASLAVFCTSNIFVGSSFYSTTVLSASAWHHISLRWYNDYSGILTVDGVPEAFGMGYAPHGITEFYIGSDMGGGNPFIGNIDELRLTWGNARISTYFTPPDSLVSYAVAEPDDPYFGATSAYLKFDSGFTDATGTTWAMGPSNNPTINNTTFKYGGGAGRFYNYANGYISAPLSISPTSTQKYTMEFWVRFVSSAGNSTILTNCRTGWGYVFFRTMSTNKLAFRWWDTGLSNYDYVSTTTINDGTWYHVAATRNGSAIKLFINGVMEASSTSTAAMNGGSTGTYVGGSSGAADSGDFLLDDLRITKNVSRYDADFTPPTSSFSTTGPAIDTTVALLLHGEGTNNGTTFTDSSFPVKTTTLLTAATTSTAQFKFGSSSIYFPGTNGNGFKANSDPNFALAGDFTVEFWVYPTLLGGGLFNLGAYNTGLYIRLNAGAIDVWIMNADFSGGATTITTNAWHHIAVCRSGTNLYKFVDGTMVTGGAIGLGGVSSIPANDIIIGYSAHSASERFGGYLDEVRLSNGTARYTANFSVPTAAFPDAVSTGGGSGTNPIGVYSISTDYVGECQVLCLDDATGVYYNDLVHRTTTT